MSTINELLAKVHELEDENTRLKAILERQVADEHMEEEVVTKQIMRDALNTNERKFYRTVVTIEVLSEAPLEGHNAPLSLADVAYQIVDGDWVGTPMKLNGKEITAKEAVDALYEFGSDPSFFSLKEDGSEEE